MKSIKASLMRHHLKADMCAVISPGKNMKATTSVCFSLELRCRELYTTSFFQFLSRIRRCSSQLSSHIKLDWNENTRPTTSVKMSYKFSVNLCHVFIIIKWKMFHEWSLTHILNQLTCVSLPQVFPSLRGATYAWNLFAQVWTFSWLNPWQLLLVFWGHWSWDFWNEKWGGLHKIDMFLNFSLERGHI